MAIQELAYAGLILPDSEGLDLSTMLGAAARVLDMHDRHPDRPARINAARHAVFGARCGIVVRQEEDSDFGPRVLLEILHRPGTETDDDLAARILSDTVLAALEHCDADVIEWYAPDVLIDRADFIRLRSYVSPRRGFDPIEAEDRAHADEMRTVLYGEDAEAPAMPTARNGMTLRKPLDTLRGRIASSSPDELRLGAAAWAMTLTLSMVVLPVAAAMAVIGIVRGMDFRLATHAMSVTMLFAALENSGSIKTVLSGLLH